MSTQTIILNRYNMDIEINQNFISVDKKTVRNSYGEYFTVGELIGHEGADDTAIIISFKPIEEENEITVITDKGYAHIDFLIKIKNEI